MVNRVEILGEFSETAGRFSAPLFSCGVAAGFPSPADDYIDSDLDLNEHLIEHPAATFYLRVQGESMNGSGIADGDLLIVDRAVQPQDGSIIIASMDGELTVKRIRRRCGRIVLEPDNLAYPSIEVGPEMELQVWGVCRYVSHDFLLPSIPLLLKRVPDGFDVH